MFSEPAFSFIAPTGKVDTEGLGKSFSTAVDKMFVVVFSSVLGVLTQGI
jgi:hypothetical protein